MQSRALALRYHFEIVLDVLVTQYLFHTLESFEFCRFHVDGFVVLHAGFFPKHDQVSGIIAFLIHAGSKLPDFNG